jgi:hypothetical protein
VVDADCDALLGLDLVGALGTVVALLGLVLIGAVEVDVLLAAAAFAPSVCACCETQFS